MGAYLNKPKTEISSSDYSNDSLSCGASAMQGWRVAMEDAHTCLMDFDQSTSLFGVFDGHGGSEVAIYAQKHLAGVLKATEGYQSGNTKKGLIEAFFKLDEDLITEEGLEELKEIAGDKDDESDNENETEKLAEEANMPLKELLERLKAASSNEEEQSSSDDEEDKDKTDEMIKDIENHNDEDKSVESNSVNNGGASMSKDNDSIDVKEDNDDMNGSNEEELDDDSEDDCDDDDDDDDNGVVLKSDEVGYDSGTTAIVALVKGDTLTVANVGDSRCVVCRNSIALEMSIDHKPEDAQELERIEKAGGKVTGEGRVNGGLNLSRALGDHSYKGRTELKPEEQQISAQPDIRQTQLTEADEFMVIACDGIWNVKNSQEVVDFVRKELKEQKLNDEKVNLSSICEKLINECLAPDTSGDGSGCDNMSCLIITFDKVSRRLSGKRKSQDDTEIPNPDKKTRINQD